MLKNSKDKMTNSVKEIWKEVFERSVWPTREEVFLKTLVVVVLLAVVAMLLGGVDYVITFATSLLLRGEFASSLFSSGIGVFVILGVLVLGVAFFVISSIRRNRFNR